MAENLCEKISEILKARRNELGLTPEELSRKAKVPLSVIEALERKEWDNLPEPVYVKGFLKKLCNVLGLDEKEMMEMFLSCELSRGVTPEIKGISISKKKKGAKISIAFIVLVLLLVGASLFYMFLQETKIYEEAPSITHKSQVQNGTFENRLASTGGITSFSANQSEEKKVAENQIKTFGEPPKVTFTVKATGGRSWYYLVVDGAKGRQGFIEDGEIMEIRCRKFCSIKFGKPSVIEIYKGKEKILLPFDRPYTVVFTPDSFKILPK